MAAYEPDPEESRRYFGTPYDRATYMRLHKQMAPIQATTNALNKRFERRGMSPPPTSRAYRDKENYLFEHKDAFEKETAAMMACVHSSSSTAKCVAKATVHDPSNPSISMPPSDRLAMLGRSSLHGKGALASFLAEQLTRQPKGSYDRTQLDAMQASIQSHHSATPMPTSPKKRPGKRSEGGRLRKSRKSRKSRKI